MSCSQKKMWTLLLPFPQILLPTPCRGCGKLRVKETQGVETGVGKASYLCELKGAGLVLLLTHKWVFYLGEEICGQSRKEEEAFGLVLLSLHELRIYLQNGESKTFSISKWRRWDRELSWSVRLPAWTLMEAVEIGLDAKMSGVPVWPPDSWGS